MCSLTKSKAIVPRWGGGGGGGIQRRLCRQWLPICSLSNKYPISGQNSCSINFLLGIKRPKAVFLLNCSETKQETAWRWNLCALSYVWITLLHMGLVSQLSYRTGIAPLQSIIHYFDIWHLKKSKYIYIYIYIYSFSFYLKKPQQSVSSV